MTSPFFRADLHCHTTCSDGTVTPVGIIDMAIAKQLSGLSITDHDTIEAYHKAAPYAAEKNFPLISGVEFSTHFQEVSIHVLAYAFPLQASPILNLCNKHIIRRRHRNAEILKLLEKHSMPISEADLEEQRGFLSATITRPHIALAMVKKGYVSSIQGAFNEYLSEGKSCYVPGVAISLEETLKTIHEAQGLAILAHPHLIHETAILRKLLDLPFDGIESYYARFSLSDNQRWLKIAARKSWIITGGSDFHGEIKPGTTLGSSWVGQETFAKLLDHYQLVSKEKKF